MRPKRHVLGASVKDEVKCLEFAICLTIQKWSGKACPLSCFDLFKTWIVPCAGQVQLSQCWQRSHWWPCKCSIFNMSLCTWLCDVCISVCNSVCLLSCKNSTAFRRDAWVITVCIHAGDQVSCPPVLELFPCRSWVSTRFTRRMPHCKKYGVAANFTHAVRAVTFHRRWT